MCRLDGENDLDGAAVNPACREAIDALKESLEQGSTPALALWEAMSQWDVTKETYKGQWYNYLVGGEAFDWQLLAERLLNELDGQGRTLREMSIANGGASSKGVSQSDVKRLLGWDKYRAFLNYYYGVLVEGAVLEAAKDEVHKARLGRGLQSKKNLLEDAFLRVYHSSRADLLSAFEEETGIAESQSLDDHQTKEFTYWLFKYRLNNSDKAKLASDTKKGLRRLGSVGAIRLVNGAARYG